MNANKCIFRTILLCALLAGIVCLAENNAVAAGSAAANCALKPETGPCKALFTKYYFDAASKSCKEFFYGGCEGVVPFETMEECQKTCQSGNQLTVTYAGRQVLSPYAEINLEYPKEWNNPSFTIKINNANAAYSHTGGGYDTEKQTGSYILDLGASGKKEILVIAKDNKNTYEKRITINWQAPAMIELLGLFGQNQALFSREPVRIFLNQVKNATVTLNGNKIRSSIGKRAKARGQILTANPKWNKGKNTLVIKALDSAGKHIEKQYTFNYMPDNVVKQGDTLALAYGYPGSKSGPFYEVKCEDKTARVQSGVEIQTSVIDKQGWLTAATILAMNITASEPGPARIRVYKKDHFTMPQILDKEIVLKVIAPGGSK